MDKTRQLLNIIEISLLHHLNVVIGQVSEGGREEGRAGGRELVTNTLELIEAHVLLESVC